MLYWDHRAKIDTEITCRPLCSVLFACVLAFCGCLSSGVTRKTASVKAAKTVEVSATELGSRNQSLLNAYSGQIEAGADRIIFGSPSPIARRQALVWKAESILVLQRALLNTDPVAAVLDAWAFIFQLEAYMEQPAVKQGFGESYPVVSETLQRMDAEMVELIKKVAPTANIEAIRQKVSSWAETHPIETTLAGRPSAHPDLTRKLELSDMGTMESLKAVGETLGDLAARLDSYNANLPKQARWQAELALMDIARDPQVSATMANVSTVSGSLAKTSATVERLPEFLGQARTAMLSDVEGQRLATQAFFRDERVAAFDTVEQERIATLAALRSERMAATADLRGERQIVLDALHNERSAAMQDFNTASDKAVKDLDGKARSLIDYFFLRALELVLITLIMLSLAAWLLLRKFGGGRQDRGGRLYDRAA